MIRVMILSIHIRFYQTNNETFHPMQDVDYDPDGDYWGTGSLELMAIKVARVADPLGGVLAEGW
jgi:hypothetical protein